MKPLDTQRLDALSLRARTALACTCLEHVVDFYRLGGYTYPIDARHAELQKLATETDAVLEAIRLGWKFARDGSTDSPLLLAIADYLEELPPRVGDPEDFDTTCASNLFVAAVCRMLDTQSDATPDSVTMAVDGCRWTVDAGVACTNAVRAAPNRSGASKALSDPERAWQLRVLERIEGLGDPPFERHMFADLVAAKLPWQHLLPEYEAYYDE
jgi:hypothetical protein